MKKTRASVFLAFLLLVAGWGSSSSDAMDLKMFLQKTPWPEGWGWVEGPKLCNKKTLFNHIDGEAELFIKYGFRGSAFGVMQASKAPEQQIDVDLYDMGTVLQAFGIFSRFRSDHRPMDVGLDSYMDDQAGLFYQGRYYVMLYAAEAAPGILKTFAGTLSTRISDPSPPPREIGFFPRTGLKEGSMQYISEGLLGHRFLGRGFVATYWDRAEDSGMREVKEDGKESQLFQSMFNGPQEAQRALNAYRAYLSKGGKTVKDEPNGSGLRTWGGEDPYRGKVVFAQKGSHLLGAVGFVSKQNAGDRLKELAARLK